MNTDNWAHLTPPEQEKWKKFYEKVNRRKGKTHKIRQDNLKAHIKHSHIGRLMIEGMNTPDIDIKAVRLQITPDPVQSEQKQPPLPAYPKPYNDN